MGKWNRGELAEGWYDPEVFQRSAEDYADLGGGGGGGQPSFPAGSPDAKSSHSRSPSPSPPNRTGQDQDQDESDYGPLPPPGPGDQPRQDHRHHTPSSSTISTARAPGPSIPTHADLSLRDEAATAARESSLTQHRLARRAHRAEEKALLDEALPRADAGTRERRLEKRKELNEKLKGFRERSPGAAAEVAEGELMGGGDSVAEYKAMVRVREEKKQERVSRREEAERARRAEREERVKEYREREERVVAGLRELARARFGGQ